MSGLALDTLLSMMCIVLRYTGICLDTYTGSN